MAPAELIISIAKKWADEANDLRMANKDNDIVWYQESGKIEAYEKLIKFLEDGIKLFN